MEPEVMLGDRPPVREYNYPSHGRPSRLVVTPFSAFTTDVGVSSMGANFSGGKPGAHIHALLVSVALRP
jgi:hypothetical protein